MYVTCILSRALQGDNIEEDNRVPLFISGPGVPRGAVSSFQANFIDLAPTILALAGTTVVRQAYSRPCLTRVIPAFPFCAFCRVPVHPTAPRWPEIRLGPFPYYLTAPIPITHAQPACRRLIQGSMSLHGSRCPSPGVSIPSGLDGLPLPLPGTPAALHTAALLGAVRHTAEAQGMDDLLPAPQQLPIPAVWWRET